MNSYGANAYAQMQGGITQQSNEYANLIQKGQQFGIDIFQNEHVISDILKKTPNEPEDSIDNVQLIQLLELFDNSIQAAQISKD
jgi:hypothetical protein